MTPLLTPPPTGLIHGRDTARPPIARSAAPWPTTRWAGLHIALSIKLPMALLIAPPIATLASCRQSAEDIANGPDPMQALAQPVRSQRYGPDYWRGVAEHDSALWARATRFCAAPDAAQYPSCASVRTVAFLRANTQPAAPATPFSFRTDSPAPARADSMAVGQDPAHAPPAR